jgi:hypothetical protein
MGLLEGHGRDAHSSKKAVKFGLAGLPDLPRDQRQGLGLGFEDGQEG